MSWGCCNRSLPTEGQTCILVVLEVRSSKSGCQQGCAPSDGSGGILLASSHPSWFQALLGHHIPLVSPSLFPWLSLVSMSSQVIGSRVHSLLFDLVLITSAKKKKKLHLQRPSFQIRLHPEVLGRQGLLGRY